MTFSTSNPTAKNHPAGATFPDIGRIVYRRLGRNGMACRHRAPRPPRSPGGLSKRPEQSHIKRLGHLAHGVTIPATLRKNLDALAQEVRIETLL